jgi:3-oxoacyl-[acyl-carrier protein] reductase
MIDSQFGLKNKIVLVTGGNTGIGKATVQLFLKLGSVCVVNFIDKTGMDGFTEEQRKRCIGIRANISDMHELSELFQDVEKRFSKLDVLVNNASVRPFSDIQGIKESDWDEVASTNLKAAFFSSKMAAMLMKKDGGKIINISSALALKGSVDGAHYCATKAGMLGLTNSFARELAPDKILVNAILPGVVETAQPKMSSAEFKEKAKSIPLGRVGQPVDVARAVIFFASDLGNYVTGQSLVVNGGQPV